MFSSKIVAPSIWRMVFRSWLPNKKCLNIFLRYTLHYSELCYGSLTTRVDLRSSIWNGLLSNSFSTLLHSQGLWESSKSLLWFFPESSYSWLFYISFISNIFSHSILVTISVRIRIRSYCPKIHPNPRNTTKL